MIVFVDPGIDMFANEYVTALINTTNTTGVMGGGIALRMRSIFPEACDDYNKRCLRKELKGGSVELYKVSGYKKVKWLFQFATKHHVFQDSKIEFIKEGLILLVNLIKEHNIKVIAIPPLGCGLGGLDWQEVKPLILEAIEPIKDRFIFYVYNQ